MLWHSWLAIPLALVIFPLVAQLRDWVDQTLPLNGSTAKLVHALIIAPPIVGVMMVMFNGLVYRHWVARGNAA